MAKKPKQDSFDAMLNDYRGNDSWHFEEMDGTHRTWPELSPEGKLAYLARDAAFAGASAERFAQAAREFLGDLPPVGREEAALQLALHNQRELHAVERLLPPEDFRHGDLAGTPLIERLNEFLSYLSERAAAKPVQEKQADKGMAGYLTKAKAAPKRDKTKGRGREM